MKIIFEPNDKPIQEQYEKHKEHFKNNSPFPKSKFVDEETSFILALISSYNTLWMQ
jgi:hypothetical protein